MPVLRVSGLGPPLDGEYDADISSFTNRELHLIKQESGVRAGEIQEAFQAGDNDLLVALTLIILQRAGKGDASTFKDAIWDAPAGSVTFDLTDEEQAEGDAVPPASEPDSDASTSLSGNASNGTGDLPASDPSPTGTPESDTGVTFDRLTSVN